MKGNPTKAENMGKWDKIHTFYGRGAIFSSFVLLFLLPFFFSSLPSFPFPSCPSFFLLSGVAIMRKRDGDHQNKSCNAIFVSNVCQ